MPGKNQQKVEEQLEEAGEKKGRSQLEECQKPIWKSMEANYELSRSYRKKSNI
jgi:hypothetical protein